MRVFVKNMRGEPLMPCKPQKARKLLKTKKAKIISYKPFTIQLTIATGETKQDVDIGVDTGSSHIGICVRSNDKVLAKGEVILRNDVKSLLETRRILRRSRRNRKTRYRKARFLNRKKPDGWLPPSIQSKIKNEFMWIDRFCSLVPNPKLHIEVGKFDVAKMINPDIEGKEYQEGQTKGYYDIRYFVFARDNYTCQVCGKSKGKVLQTHHIVYRSNGGTNRADNLITVCNDCHTHENHQPGGILYKWQEKHKKVKQYKEPVFMNIVRRRIFEKYPDAEITYGSETVIKRKNLGLEKTHYNDAVAISGMTFIKKNENFYFILAQARKKKRSLHEATPRKGKSKKNVGAIRNSKNTKFYKGFFLNDKVVIENKIGWICGFCSGGCYVKDIFENYITICSKEYKQVVASKCKLVNRNNNWRFTPSVSPQLK